MKFHVVLISVIESIIVLSLHMFTGQLNIIFEKIYTGNFMTILIVVLNFVVE